MQPKSRNSARFCRIILALLLSLLGGCSPLGWILSSNPTTVDELSRRLTTDARPVVFDLRSQAEFVAGHIPSAHRVAYADVGSAARRVNQAEELVLVCQHGRLAALALASVRGVGHTRVSVLDGGYAVWDASRRPTETGDRPIMDSPKSAALMVGEPIRALVWATGTIIKPTYMLMTLGLIWWLRRTNLRSLKLLRLGLTVFLIGESGCLFNFYLSDPKAPFQWLESLHELGMAVGSAYIFWGLYGIIETKFVSMNELSRGCAMIRLCGSCSRQPDILCQPQRQLRHLILLLTPLVLLPWSLELVVRDVWLDVFGTIVDYRWPILNQLLELRLFPLIAAFAFLGSWALLAGPRRWLEPAHGLFFLGLGLLSFAVMRGLLDATFTVQPYYADTWEEVTELMGIGTIGLVLWVFRRSLALSAPPVRP